MFVACASRLCVNPIYHSHEAFKAPRIRHIRKFSIHICK
jgi:hypothetical protein